MNISKLEKAGAIARQDVSPAHWRRGHLSRMATESHALAARIARRLDDRRPREHARRVDNSQPRLLEAAMLDFIDNREGMIIMALNNRTKLGITIAVAVIAGLAFVWLAMLLLMLAVFLIVWGEAPERTEAFVKSLPYGNSIIGALDKWI
jgi:hypothetical protein